MHSAFGVGSYRNLERERYSSPEVLWKGPDIEIAKSVVVHRSERVPIVLKHESLPPSYVSTHWSIERFQYVMKDIYPSVRSRYAQLGININDNVVRQIENWLRNNTHLDEKTQILNPIVPFIDVENFGGRPVQLDKGVRLFRFYEEPSLGTILQGDDLKDAVRSGLIKIEGERLGAWTYSYSRDSNTNPVGIFVHIKRNDRKWIPPDSRNPISIPDAGEYRQAIDSFLRSPIPEDQLKKILWIGETVEMTLSPKIDAILDKIAITDVYDGISNSPANGVQINSRFIDGGKTAWPVRVEVFSNTCPMPQYVHFRFVKKVVN